MKKGVKMVNICVLHSDGVDDGLSGGVSGAVQQRPQSRPLLRCEAVGGGVRCE